MGSVPVAAPLMVIALPINTAPPAGCVLMTGATDATVSTALELTTVLPDPLTVTK